ncbi:MAG: diaminopimelate epimerase [Prolixibacteraceae bacterium]|nr:diaminopimelate epimerase [Prolixibacteraceae bacterium]
MDTEFYKYHGAGNDFVLIDNRNLIFPADNISRIEWLCSRRFGIGADGLMLLQNSEGFDFEMRYFNSDGREASMCGNGGRCIVAFARQLGIIKNETCFLAVDGPHRAAVEENGDINLQMSDVNRIEIIGDNYFLDTGSPHFVCFLDNLDNLNVYTEGRAIRYNSRFKETGTNVNFVKQEGEHLTVYTYERGVEAETLSCGTGSAASALAAAVAYGFASPVKVYTHGGDALEIGLAWRGSSATELTLTGPAVRAYGGRVDIG